jgi:hypothetical protein
MELLWFDPSGKEHRFWYDIVGMKAIHRDR